MAGGVRVVGCFGEERCYAGDAKDCAEGAEGVLARRTRAKESIAERAPQLEPPSSCVPRVIHCVPCVAPFFATTRATLADCKHRPLVVNLTPSTSFEGCHAGEGR